MYPLDGVDGFILCFIDKKISNIDIPEVVYFEDYYKKKHLWI